MLSGDEELTDAGLFPFALLLQFMEYIRLAGIVSYKLKSEVGT